MPNKILLDSKKIEIILSRLVYQLIENHKDFQDTVLLGLQPRGIFLIDKILEVFKRDHPNIEIKSGILDYTFFRDDFRRSEKILSASSTKIDFSIENKNVVLIDDVLFTGRSIKAAMSSIDTYGRPKSIELLVLIDRRFKREIPIEANYCGAKIDTFKGDRVKVLWGEKLKDNVIYIES
ncbi:MAG: bifunctional pyr operon transcriptional regulator/uracil phosphoribosyltransferase PyrR [Cryomorphaceae bacterium]|jgi:pyrimidine operon attenuation protein/uracil phosphoribosyltransferase|nr:bifunctional pyr operon transcriptional regulator/uracil phosphoribosyltransferase PyrR [Cryomorphaceae bacterium]MBT3503137.1 bifunctional pyr operon transcriptional regulator/uracil phosphoribosyltransferase PyrR [Cryomorphaceae bacterium]MBT4222042.1 bifunctional pyr operon transcriptional regulator/uracil phosphoribosyltransferase PyrR [Cryomorphaceae bacterium]MBT4293595.1 bifunctional pyr operon transcriptional regulator/uracil phosphoribosyltransferase PyrR [Cryomorphaceae bacterium]M